MTIKFSDLVKDCALEFKDPNYEVFSIDDWKRLINIIQHETYPRIYRRTFVQRDTVANQREYDLSAVSPEIRDVVKVYYYPQSDSTKPSEVRDWIWDQYQKKIRFRTALTGSKWIKIEYITNLADLEVDTATIDVTPEVRTVIMMMSARAALRRLLLDRVKMDKYRTTVDDQTTPYVLSNILAGYDRDIELRLREIKMPLVPTEVKIPEKEYGVEEKTRQHWVTYGY